jgi:peptide/nickel transport system permease protein
MLRYLARRLGQSVIVLLGVTLVVFTLIHLVPGDPVRVGLGTRFDPAVYAALRHRAGLDQSLPVQYLSYVTHALGGDLGVSFRTGAPVTQVLLERLPATLSLAVTALLIGLLIAVPLGVLSALHHDTWIDSAARVVSQVGVSVPDFWIGILLILLVSGGAGWLPPSGYVALTADPVGWARHVILPAVAVGLVAASILTRFIRSAVLEELTQDYIRTAEAKGLTTTSILRRHVLRNASVPVLTVTGVQLATLLGGVIVIEVLFAWPGLGLLTYQAVQTRDYPVLQGAVLLVAAIFLVINLVVDVLYAVIDPRISLR